MKLTKERLKEIIREELVTEADIDKKVDTKEIVKRMMKNFKGQYAWVGKAWSKELLRKYKKGMSQTDFIIDAENLKNTFGGQGIDTIFKGLNEKVFGSQAQYDAYRKKNNLKPGSKHKVAGKTVTVRGKGKMSKKAKSAADSIAAKLNAKMDALNKKSKQGKVNEVDYEKVTLPAQVKRWMGKFVDSMKDANLNRLKRSAILYKVIEASGISMQQLMTDIQKIKRKLK